MFSWRELADAWITKLSLQWAFMKSKNECPASSWFLTRHPRKPSHMLSNWSYLPMPDIFLTVDYYQVILKSGHFFPDRSHCKRNQWSFRKSLGVKKALRVDWCEWGSRPLRTFSKMTIFQESFLGSFERRWTAGKKFSVSRCDGWKRSPKSLSFFTSLCPLPSVLLFRLKALNCSKELELDWVSHSWLF